MPYERYAEAKLGHGCVIDEGLWQRVQDKVKELDGVRAKATRHCYPLSGLLVFDDGSSFAGSGAWGSKTYKSTYYYNKVNKIRVKTEIFETETEKALHQVIENSPEYRKSIANYLEQKDASIEVVARKIAEVDARLVELGDEKRQLDKRLSFLLKGSAEMAESFRDEYQKQLLALRNEEHDLEHKKSELKLLQRQVAKEQEPSKNGKLEQIKAALGYIRKKDFVALKSIYKQLFEKIVVRPLDNAKVQLEFVFNKATSSIRNGEVAFCTAVGLVGTREVESLTSAMSTLRSNQLSYAPALAAHAKQKYSECQACNWRCAAL